MSARFYLINTILITTLTISFQASAMPPGPGGHGGPDIFHWPAFIIPEGFHHSRPEPIPPFYFGHNLPAGVAFAVFAGITYAIVDGMYYYRHEGDRYIYVEAPPAGSYQVIEKTKSSSSSALDPGTIVSKLPDSAKKVEYKGETYYVVGENWYLPLISKKSNHDYVVVNNPLN